MKKLFFLVFLLLVLFYTSKLTAYSVRFGWQNPNPPVDEILVRIALTRKDIEMGSEGNLFYWDSLDPDVNFYDVPIIKQLYGGFYFSVTLVRNEEEGAPVIIPHKPGNIVGTTCDLIPPFGFYLAVTSLDVSRLMWFLKFSPVIPPLNPDFPAGEQERCDFSGDGKITSIDYSFLIYTLKYYPYMGDRPVWGGN